MIRNKVDLKRYIQADYERQRMKHPLWARLTYGEHDLTRRYLCTLRHLEYYKNNRTGLFNKLLYAYYFLKYRRNCVKMGMYIMPNTCNEGLLLPHPGFVRVDSFCKIGKNCTILPMVLFGKKHPGSDCAIEVGDNCYISTGVTILGSVKIGNNVTVAAGAVVNKDIPDNCVVAGVPSKIVRVLNINNLGGDRINLSFSKSAA